MNYYHIALPIRSFEPLTYGAQQNLSPGQGVEVYLRKKKIPGLVVGQTTKPKDFEVKPVHKTLDELSLSETYFKWVLWLSDYYQYPLGLIFQSCFPPLNEKENNIKPIKQNLKKFELTPAQQKALLALKPLEGFKAHLLHGVTGSGKTEIYLELFEEVLTKQKKQGLFLLPEIALTPQLEKRFQQRFGSLVSTYHSQLTPRQKTNTWYNFKRGRLKS